ncbi:MAG: TetR/AcrR family transcriptional regulator [Flavobacteriales bacterium]|nr:TetR/AcrR family transcriptional regulator [Flavobacteriales bacterium]
MNFTSRQIEILDASKSLIGERGIQTLTIKNLAKKMSFSEPALYRHFKDKTEIIKALLLYHREIVELGVKKIIQSNNNAVCKFQEILKFKFKHIENNPELVMIIFSETSFQYDSVLSACVSSALEERVEKINSLIKSGQNEGCIRNDIDSKQIATIILGGIRTTILSWKLSNFKSSLQKDGKKLWLTFETLLKK